jgi:hypothetical protein
VRDKNHSAGRIQPMIFKILKKVKKKLFLLAPRKDKNKQLKNKFLYLKIFILNAVLNK